MSEHPFALNGWLSLPPKVSRRRVWHPVASMDDFGVAVLACGDGIRGSTDPSAEVSNRQQPPPTDEWCASARQRLRKPNARSIVQEVKE